MKKMKLLFALAAMTALVFGTSTLCYARTISVLYGNSAGTLQSAPEETDNFNRLEMTYVPGAGNSSSTDAYSALRANGISDADAQYLLGGDYMQMTTSVGSSAPTIVNIAPLQPGQVPTDMDAYNMTYLSALQAYGLAVDPVSGQIVQ